MQPLEHKNKPKNKIKRTIKLIQIHRKIKKILEISKINRKMFKIVKVKLILNLTELSITIKRQKLIPFVWIVKQTIQFIIALILWTNITTDEKLKVKKLWINYLLQKRMIRHNIIRRIQHNKVINSTTVKKFIKVVINHSLMQTKKCQYFP